MFYYGRLHLVLILLNTFMNLSPMCYVWTINDYVIMYGDSGAYNHVSDNLVVFKSVLKIIH